MDSHSVDTIFYVLGGKNKWENLASANIKRRSVKNTTKWKSISNTDKVVYINNTFRRVRVTIAAVGKQ